MKVLTKEEANTLLKCVGIEIGNWNQPEYLGETFQKESVVKYFVPRNADQLYSFSYQLFSFLQESRWLVFQIDNSTSLLTHENFLISSLFCNYEAHMDFNIDRTIFFNLQNHNSVNFENNMVFIHLIYYFLLFEAHGYIIASNSDSNGIIALQDGCVYFICRDDLRKKSILAFIKNFEKNPLALTYKTTPQN